MQRAREMFIKGSDLVENLTSFANNLAVINCLNGNVNGVIDNFEGFQV